MSSSRILVSLIKKKKTRILVHVFFLSWYILEKKVRKVPFNQFQSTNHYLYKPVNGLDITQNSCVFCLPLCNFASSSKSSWNA